MVILSPIWMLFAASRLLNKFVALSYTQMMGDICKPGFFLLSKWWSHSHLLKPYRLSLQLWHFPLTAQDPESDKPCCWTRDVTDKNHQTLKQYSSCHLLSTSTDLPCKLPLFGCCLQVMVRSPGTSLTISMFQQGSICQVVWSFPGQFKSVLIGLQIYWNQ